MKTKASPVTYFQSLHWKDIKNSCNWRYFLQHFLRESYFTPSPNADKPQPKESAHGKNFHEFISVRVPFREPDFFAFFAKISLVTD
jgi:hypothetical protein